MTDADGAIRMKGPLVKLGGGDGGRKSWKTRFFVLTDNLSYYKNEEAYTQNKDPINTVTLNAYYVSANKDSEDFEFTVHAYPKSLTCKAASDEERTQWTRVLMEPLAEYFK